MPALVTHYLFGIDALVDGVLGSATCSDARARQAFLIGCQGPDPLFFAFSTPHPAQLHRLAQRMHRAKGEEALRAMGRAALALPEESQPIGWAYACGFLAHYALDHIAHPYVYAMENTLCSFPELADSHHEVHALIESDVDMGMVDRLRRRLAVARAGGATLVAGADSGDGPAVAPSADCAAGVKSMLMGGLNLDRNRMRPVDVLACPTAALRIAGELVAACAREVYGVPMAPNDFVAALLNMRLCYRLIEPADSKRVTGLANIERIARSRSVLAALAHKPGLDEGCASMNPKRRAWSDPVSGEEHRESFPDVYGRALAWYREAVRRYGSVDGKCFGKEARSVTDEANYLGRPWED